MHISYHTIISPIISLFLYNMEESRALLVQIVLLPLHLPLLQRISMDPFVLLASLGKIHLNNTHYPVIILTEDPSKFWEMGINPLRTLLDNCSRSLYKMIFINSINIFIAQDNIYWLSPNDIAQNVHIESKLVSTAIIYLLNNSTLKSKYLPDIFSFETKMQCPEIENK